MTIGVCRKCHKRGKLTEHHWIPRRAKPRSNHTVWICRKCHDLADAELVDAEKAAGTFLTASQYQLLITQFLRAA